MSATSHVRVSLFVETFETLSCPGNFWKKRAKKKNIKIEKKILVKKKKYIFFIKSGKLPDMTGLLPLKIKKPRT